MGGGRSPRPPPAGPSAAQLEEERRKLALIRQNQSGRGSTILTSGILGADSVLSQTLLGR